MYKSLSCKTVFLFSLIAPLSSPLTASASEFRLGPFDLKLLAQGATLKPSATLWLDGNTEAEAINAKIRGDILFNLDSLVTFVTKVSKRTTPYRFRPHRKCVVTVNRLNYFSALSKDDAVNIEFSANVSPSCERAPRVTGDIKIGFDVKPQLKGNALALHLSNQYVEIPLAWQAGAYVISGIDLGGELAKGLKEGIEHLQFEWKTAPILQYTWKQARFKGGKRTLAVDIQADMRIPQEAASQLISSTVKRQSFELKIPEAQQ